jgi:hypothetical protein
MAAFSYEVYKIYLARQIIATPLPVVL